ncbi:MAG TPA: hypothetical protein P5026_02850 [Kiritimatiellia bacterium]|nr:hypothetical protein [Kiritimatiellia bacterium]HRU70423.1 hypothetical protein [Kiritimatiellia bacterium]
MSHSTVVMGTGCPAAWIIAGWTTWFALWATVTCQRCLDGRAATLRDPECNTLGLVFLE